VLVLALRCYWHGATPTALALSALTTGFATFAIAYYMSLPYKANLKPSGLWNRYVSDYLKFLLPILAGQVVIISFTLVDQLMASFLPVGNISALNYASLLITCLLLCLPCLLPACCIQPYQAHQQKWTGHSKPAQLAAAYN